jgi:flagellar biosynthetic protein FlhB
MPNTYPINLQFFAGEKTEKATPKKRQESRSKGQVAKSAEVPTAIIMLGVFLLLFFIGNWMIQIFLNLFHHSFTEYMQWNITESNVSTIFREVSFEAAKSTFPLMLIALVAGVFGNYLQIGFLFATDPLKMKLEKIDPIKGFKRIFSMRAIVEFLKSVFKIVIVSFIAFSFIWYRKDEIFLLSQKGIGNALVLIATITFQIGISVAIVLLFLSILDYLYQKYDFEKNIRMSKHDVKDEHKKSEGDPLIKRKIRERQIQMAMRRMMQEVPKADVIITNPTHFAIAIKYDPKQMEAPMVVAKGVDLVALKIKEIANEYGILTMENKPLARALYHQVEIGDSVPEDLYKAVAEVLAYVYKLQGKA